MISTLNMLDFSRNSNVKYKMSEKQMAKILFMISMKEYNTKQKYPHKQEDILILSENDKKNDDKAV